MKNYPNKKKALALFVGSSMVLAGVMSSQVFAQEQEELQEIEEAVVTGSRITDSNITSSSPIVSIETEAFVARGTVDAVDLLNTLPSAVAAQTSEVSNGANGISTLNLRGLGTSRTLVLLDGKRLGPGRSDTPVADLNQIPTQLIKRAEIVTGGASAVYGSDAIGGVANFILDRDFEGFEISTVYGFNQDGNSNGFAQDVLTQTATDGIIPTGSVTDGETVDVSILFGFNSEDGRGNVTGYFRYLDQNEILQGTRDVSRCALGDFGPEIGADIFCFGSNFGPFPTTFSNSPILDASGVPLNPQPGVQGTVSLDENGNVPRDAAGNVVTGATNPFNFNPLNFFQRPTERIQAGFFANYELNDNVEFYADVGFTRNQSDAQIAPTATFGNVSEINCDNPFLSAELLQIICTDRGLGGSDLAPIQLNRRNVEGGGRSSNLEITNFRIVTGARGEINSNWNYDVFAQFSDTSSTDTDTEDFEIDLLNEALLAVTGADGSIVCSSGRTGCIPLNLFGTTPVDPLAIAAISTPTVLTGSAEQTVFGASVQGELEGVSSPLASSNVQLIIGVESRTDTLVTQPDSILLLGGSTGLGGPTTPAAGEAQVDEFFFEAAIPLIEGRSLAEEVSLSLAYRFSDYSYQNNLPGGGQSDGVDADTFAIGLAWAPISQLRFRAQFQEAVRAPNVFDLFDPSAVQLFNANDPCSGASPTATLDACVASGLPATLFGLVPPDAGQLNELTGGNTSLQPETSNTFTFGFVAQPTDNLTVSVDYFDIEVEDFINSLPSQSVINGCLFDGDTDLCSLFNRDNLGTIQINGFIEANLQNIAVRETSGIDLSIGYGFGVGRYGDVSINYTSTFIFDFEQQSFVGAAPDDCLGFFTGPCDDIVGQPTFEYSHVATALWRTNRDVDVTLSWRYLDSVQRFGTDTPGGETGGIGDTFGSESFFDLSAVWRLNDSVTLNVGVNNVLDTDPPVTNFFETANGNTFPGVYDSAGRYIFFGAKYSL